MQYVWPEHSAFTVHADRLSIIDGCSILGHGCVGGSIVETCMLFVALKVQDPGEMSTSPIFSNGALKRMPPYDPCPLPSVRVFGTINCLR